MWPVAHQPGGGRYCLNQFTPARERKCRLRWSGVVVVMNRTRTVTGSRQRTAVAPLARLAATAGRNDRDGDAVLAACCAEHLSTDGRTDRAKPSRAVDERLAGEVRAL